MVTSRPRSSTRIEPPSSTIGASKTTSPYRPARTPPAASSRSQPANFSPQALNRKWTPARRPAIVECEDRPVVAHPRVVDRQLDQVDADRPAGPGPRRRPPRRAPPLSPAQRRLRRWRPRHSRARAADNSLPQISRRHGHAISVRSCGAVSGGIRNPWSAGDPVEAATVIPMNGNWAEPLAGVVQATPTHRACATVRRFPRVIGGRRAACPNQPELETAICLRGGRRFALLPDTVLAVCQPRALDRHDRTRQMRSEVDVC